MTPASVFRVRREECQLERCGSQPPIEQILILDTVPIIVHTVLVHPPAPSVLTAPWMCCAHCCSPGCGANFRRVEVCPSSFTSLPEDSPTTLVTSLLLLQTFSIPLTRNYLKFLPGRPRRFQVLEQHRGRHFQCPLRQDTSLCSGGHPFWNCSTLNSAELTPLANRATFSPHVPALKLAGSPHLSCLQMIGLKLRYPVSQYGQCSAHLLALTVV